MNEMTRRKFLMGAGAGIAVAAVSWFGLERPILRLKRRGPGRGAGATAR